MKTMTCNNLGGACDMEFHAETWEEMAELSRKHGQEMGEKDDKPHIEAMGKMEELMKDPTNMQEWMNNKQNKFNALPEDQQ